MSIILLVATLAATPAEQCRQTHYMADGRVIVTDVDADDSGVSARSQSRGSNGASSSVSVSSSSNGRSSASSSSSSDGASHSVSVKRDANGCTITIDDRPPQE